MDASRDELSLFRRRRRRRGVGCIQLSNLRPDFQMLCRTVINRMWCSFIASIKKIGAVFLQKFKVTNQNCIQRFRMMRSPNRFLFNLIIKEIWIWVKEIYIHYYYFSERENLINVNFCNRICRCYMLFWLPWF
jgi:hypothetical protein